MGWWNGIKTTALRGKKRNPKPLYTSELNAEDFDIKVVHECNYNQILLSCEETWTVTITHCRALPCFSLLMTGRFFPALNLCPSASDSGAREKWASIQPPEKAALALVIFIHCIVFIQHCHQQQGGVYHELNRQMKWMELFYYWKGLQILITEIDLETGKLSATKSWNNFSAGKYIFCTTLFNIK